MLFPGNKLKGTSFVMVLVLSLGLIIHTYGLKVNAQFRMWNKKYQQTVEFEEMKNERVLNENY